MKLKRSSLFMKIVILALIVYACIALVGAKNRIAAAKADQAELQAKKENGLAVRIPPGITQRLATSRILCYAKNRKSYRALFGP